MSIRLTWDDINPGENGFRIYRATSAMNPEALPAALTSLGPDQVEYLDENVTAGTEYFYRVSAYKGSLEVVSGEVSIIAGGVSPSPNFSQFFASSQQGLACNFTDQSSLFTDYGGTVPVSASGDLVRYVSDLSGNGNHLIALNDTYRATFIDTGTDTYLNCNGDGFYLPGSASLFKFLHNDTGFGVAYLFEASFNNGIARLLSTSSSSSGVGLNVFSDDRSGSGLVNGIDASVFKGTAGIAMYSLRVSNTVPQNTRVAMIMNGPAAGPLAADMNESLYSDAKTGTQATGDADNDLGVGVLTDYPTSYPLVGKLRALVIRDQPFTPLESDELKTIFAEL